MRPAGPTRRVVALLALALSGAVAAFATIAPAPDLEPAPLRAAVIEPLPIAASEVLLPAPGWFIREERFQRGETVPVFLMRFGLAALQIERLKREPALRHLRPGLTVAAEVSAAGELVFLSFLSGRDTQITLAPLGEGYVATEERAPLETQLAMKSSVILSSLFAAADAAGVPDSVALQLADVFGGDIDFHRDLRRGDRFTVVYELRALRGRPVRAGRVLAAEFLNQGKLYRAVHFGSSYYTPDGRNLRKAFLRSPLDFSRVSSGFGMRRHPFLQIWRAHQGIDYAAPAGSRVRAVGDGVVEFAGHHGGYGKLVILRHHGQYSSAYAHLSAFARGLHRGVRVSQGETLGTVGQTGWATGPHLHYEFRIAGQARNPLAIALPAAQPVAAHEMAEFRRHAEPLAARLDLLADSHLALLE